MSLCGAGGPGPSVPRLIIVLLSQAATASTAPPAASRGWKVPATSFVMLAALVGAGIGAAVLLGDWWSWPARSACKPRPAGSLISFAAPSRLAFCEARQIHRIVHSSQFVLWAALICAQTTFWTLAAAPVFSMLRRNWAGWRSQRWDIIISGLLLVAVAVSIVAVTNYIGPVPGPHPSNQVFPHQHVKIWSITGVALILALGASVSIWLIRGRLDELRTDATDREIELFIEFRSELERLLGILGAIVGLAVLATAALRQVVLEYVSLGHEKASFPPDYPILYGLILSLVVALVYLPTYLALLKTGSDLRDRAAPLGAPGEPDFEAVIAKRRTLTDLLGLEISASTSFRVSATILSPLFAALISLLPKLGG